LVLRIFGDVPSAAEKALEECQEPTEFNAPAITMPSESTLHLNMHVSVPHPAVDLLPEPYTGSIQPHEADAGLERLQFFDCQGVGGDVMPSGDVCLPWRPPPMPTDPAFFDDDTSTLKSQDEPLQVEPWRLKEPDRNAPMDLRAESPNPQQCDRYTGGAEVFTPNFTPAMGPNSPSSEGSLSSVDFFERRPQ
jgi:hypothetical protein